MSRPRHIRFLAISDWNIADSQSDEIEVRTRFQTLRLPRYVMDRLLGAGFDFEHPIRYRYFPEFEATYYRQYVLGRKA